MTEREKFWYDTMGYLVVRDFLSPEEVDRLNAAFDENRAKMVYDGNSNTGNSTTLKGHKRGMFSGMLTCTVPGTTISAWPPTTIRTGICGRGWWCFSISSPT